MLDKNKNMYDQYPSQPKPELEPTAVLAPGQERNIDTEQTVIDGAALGFDQDTLERFHVFGTFDFRNTAGQKEGKVALLKGDFNGASETVYVVGLTKDPDGRRTPMPLSHWMPLQKGMPTELGRASQSDKLLFGREFTNMTSRHQATVTWGENGLNLKNASEKNDMKFDGVIKVDEPDDSIWENFSTDAPEVIPAKTGGFVVGQLLPPPEAIEQSHDQNHDQAAEAFEGMKVLKEGLNEVDSDALYDYAAGKYNQWLAVNQGNEQEARNAAHQAGKGWNNMSSEARQVSDRYAQLFAEYNDLLARN